jgi:hypothetical protein
MDIHMARYSGGVWTEGRATVLVSATEEDKAAYSRVLAHKAMTEAVYRPRMELLSARAAVMH